MMKKGVTIIELLVVMGIMAILFSLSAVSFGYLHMEGRFDYVSTELKDAIYTAKARSLNGDPTGVYIESQKAVIFKGTSYDPDDPGNIETAIPDDMIINSINLPLQVITFSSVTGYPSNYAAPYNFMLNLKHGSESRTFTVNKIGIVEIN